MRRVQGIKLLFFVFPLLLFLPLLVAGKNDWFSVSHLKEGHRSVTAFPITELDSAVYSIRDSIPVQEDTLPTHLKLVCRSNDSIFLSMDSIFSMELRSNVAKLYIDTEPELDEIEDKENYVKAKLKYISSEEDSLVSEVDIRGRGNSTWFMPKKPYRLKFPKKVSLAGMSKAKSYVLIANYLDNTLMKNSVAFKLAELAGLPYFNTSVPVDLYFNGVPRGSYLLTEKIGMNSGSVDIDENFGALWEIDANFDEDSRFESSKFQLPCMLKDPDFSELAENDTVISEVFWNYWKADLDLAIAKVAMGRWQEVFDADQLAAFILVNHVLGNYEISQGKSIYLYKTKDGEKYCFGPVWDFDWALGFTEHAHPVRCQFLLKDTIAYDFWLTIFKDVEFQEVFRAHLEDFYVNNLDLLMEFIDEYADKILISAYRDAELWPDEKFYGFEKHEITTRHFEDNVDFLKNYILERIDFIRSSSNCALY